MHRILDDGPQEDDRVGASVACVFRNQISPWGRGGHGPTRGYPDLGLQAPASS
jgi:hypothetical protein